MPKDRRVVLQEFDSRKLLQVLFSSKSTLLVLLRFFSVFRDELGGSASLGKVQTMRQLNLLPILFGQSHWDFKRTPSSKVLRLKACGSDLAKDSFGWLKGWMKFDGD